MINVYTKAVIEVTQEQWVLLYEEESKKILLEPQQASGFYTAVDVLVVADTKEELDQYIVNNDLQQINFENNDLQQIDSEINYF